ncbi:uncharacterized protein EV422DRAFT_339089 [Fimicolochytrium jonesii]|uniref:uncharacterized protein n=1 Tax=Fimicolochytrium jonesii TaxID=1396493 RepID=UPI0022FDBA62|nr:uncharacterized protein EV422DRAFT_339089 [Fimicolochytrium jonesii]KAI8815866.1 hypothetical protein EV422DRAFT_339089 [Fimicolochytrium jonesii]
MRPCHGHRYRYSNNTGRNVAARIKQKPNIASLLSMRTPRRSRGIRGGGASAFIWSLAGSVDVLGIWSSVACIYLLLEKLLLVHEIKRGNRMEGPQKARALSHARERERERAGNVGTAHALKPLGSLPCTAQPYWIAPWCHPLQQTYTVQHYRLSLRSHS